MVSPDLKDSDYKPLDEIREIRNYRCHQCYIDYVYISDDAKRENKFREIANRLYYDENRTWDLHESFQKIWKKPLTSTGVYAKMADAACAGHLFWGD